jgi:hypothetical protein
MVIAGLVYATGTGQRQAAALAAAGCEPGLSSSGAPCTTEPELAGQYLAVMTPARRQLDVDMAAYTASEGRHLALAEAALLAEATSEQGFGASLAAVKLPPAVIPVAETLIRASQALARLITEQARSTSLTQLRSFDLRVQRASAAVQAEMTLVLKAIESPPPAG